MVKPLNRRYVAICLAGVVLAGAAFAIAAESALFRRPDAPSPYIARRTDQFRALPSTAKVVMLGDSLTAEGEWSELLGPGVVNRGIGRDTSAGVLARLDTVPKSEKVFLMIGANDLSLGVPVETIAANTRQIVEQLPRPVYVQSVLYRSGMEAKVDDLNARNRAMCEGRCVYVDLNTAVGRKRFDGLHLGGEEYHRWAAAIEPYI